MGYIRVLRRLYARCAHAVLRAKVLLRAHASYAVPSALSLSLVALSIPGTFASAATFTPGSYVGMPAASCESVGTSWNEPQHAAGKPTLDADAATALFTTSNAAHLEDPNNALACSGFKNPEQRRQRIGLGLSLAITSNQTSAAHQNTPADTHPDTAAFLLDTGFTLDQPNVPSGSNPLDSVVRIDISKDKGATWQPLHVISDSSLSNATQQHYIGLALPNGMSGSFDQMSIRAQGLRAGDASTQVYIDSLFLVYQAAPGQRLTLKSATQPTGDKPVFAAQQPAAFTLEVDRQGEGIVQGIASKFAGDKSEPDATIQVAVEDANGTTIEGVGFETTWKGKALNGNDVWDISLSQPTTITPGSHTATVTIMDDTGNTQSVQQDFLWGVLAINTHKSIYQPGETVHFDMAVLNEKGEMTCDATLQLQIEGQQGTVLSTQNGTIIVNKECQEKHIVEKPDYSASWTVPTFALGDVSSTYKLTLTAKTANGEFTITDSFRVGDPEPITITRTAPTRIMPANRYTTRMKVVAQQDFTGAITETVPAVFAVSRYDTLYEYVDGSPSRAIPVTATVTPGSTPDEQIITWNVALKKDVAYELHYGYKAPDISPEFYLTGPLTFTQQDEELFKEHRQWQIASDAPWLTGWSYRKALTVNAALVDSDLTNFPLLVRLSNTNFNFSKARSDGYDIRFTSSDMVTTLSYERERHDTSGQKAEYWVRVPTVTTGTNTVIYMYYGKTDASDGQNATGTWSSVERSVMHFRESPDQTCTLSFEVCDSTSNATHADTTTAMLSTDKIEGKIGPAINFNGTDDSLTAGDIDALDGINRFTVSGWVKLNSLVDFPAVVAKFSSNTSKFLMQESGAGQGTNNDVTVSVSNGTNISGYTTGNILATGTWGYWTMVYDGSLANNAAKLKFYFNGVQQTLTFTAGTVPTTTPTNTAAVTYAQYATGAYLSGAIDEVRVTTAARGAAWVKASYNNENDTLLAYGSEEAGNLAPDTPTYNGSPLFHNARTNSTTPSLGTFWSVERDGDLVQYEVQWDDDPTFASPVTRSSVDHATNGFSAASFDGANQPTSYDIQPGEALTNGTTYWWRVRALDVGTGTNTWSSYSTPQAFTVNTSIGSVNQWHETTDAQFNDDTTTGVRTLGADNISLTPLTYRYVKWEVTGRRGPSANSIQASEFVLRYNNASVAWPAGTTATNPGGNSAVGEEPPKAIDGTTSTKWLDFNFALNNNTSLTGSSSLVIDVGAANTVTFSGYYWATANDFPERDPVSWNVYGSNDGTNWSLVDARSSQTITTTRLTFGSELVNDTRFDYRYLQFETTKRRAAADSVQLAEIQLLNNGSAVTWPSGTTATSTGASFVTGEEPSKLIDNSTTTKFRDSAFSADSSGTSGRTVVAIDTGANKSIRFNDYRVATAADTTARDPVSWKLYGSNDGSTWTIIDIKEDYPITTSRSTYTSALSTLAEPGAIMSEPIAFTGVSLAESWNQLSAATTEPSGSNVLVRVYYATSGTTCNALVPDTALSGNSAGLDISAGSVNLTGLNTSTYSVLCLGAKLRPGTTTVSPSLNDWTLSWDRNTEPSAPTVVGQTKTDTTSIATGAWINENTVRFTATASNTETGEAIQLCVEAQPIGITFTGNETGCGSSVLYNGTPVALTATISGLTNNTEYHWQAWVKDVGNVHNFPSSPLAYGSNLESVRDFAVDTTAPTGGIVYDGTTIGVDASLNDGSLSSLSANWSSFDASPSGLVRYEYAIGTTIGGNQTKDWTSTNTATSVTVTGLTLQTSQVYYVSVRAVDNAGNTQSPVMTSSGQLVAPSLSFAASPAAMQFDNLNVGNNYTSAKATTLTTSTNAYRGYVVRLAATDYLSDGASSIPAFTGGSYDTPNAWDAADVGVGYTSNDNDIQGVNKFQASVCAGGRPRSGAGCFAPYSQTRPGDIVADHIANVTGSPLTNQQFTITHRVSTSATQKASTYSMVLLYAATALY